MPCPHLRDRAGHLRVNGIEFAQWVEEIWRHKYKSGRPKLTPDQATCLHCNAILQFVDPTRVHAKGRLYFIPAPSTGAGSTEKFLMITHKNYQHCQGASSISSGSDPGQASLGRKILVLPAHPASLAERPAPRKSRADPPHFPGLSQPGPREG